MAGIIWSKFFWSDWQADPALRLCSFAAKGLWMDMLCIASAHDPIGYVAVAGRGLNETSIARMTGGLESEVRALLGELDQNGVFSRDRKGTIYSRRMVSDARKAAIAKKNGKNGGNPSLSNHGGNPASDNPPDKPPLKPHKPLSKSHKPSSSLRSEQPALPDWVPPAEWAAFLEIRTKQRVPNTPSSLDLLIRKLERLRADGVDPVAVLEQSIERGWKGLFPIRADDAPRQQSRFPETKIIQVA